MQHILRLIDEHFNEEDGHLVFDNAHLDLVDTRMTVFRSSDQWVMFTEVVLANQQDWHISVETHAVGSCLWKQGLLYEESRVPFEWSSESSSSDSLDQHNFAILLNGEMRRFMPSEADYSRVGADLQNSGCLFGHSCSLAAITRYVCHQLRHPFLSSEDHLRYLVDKYRPSGSPSAQHQLKVLLQTNQWQHPDMGFELPSQLLGFQTLARAIESGNLQEWQDLDASLFNSNWPYWMQKKRELFGF